ncbi:Syntaxin-binding protein 5 [Pseudolycoriella hygida]|uniref:Syntaxin-binding protein 5 n=1 Tax=Pseudolycoriella hygida TaxID=35572 RepID=A0A9Q0RYM7_9DIPT|nr:Syntaxin-binding protein 5 [Pseudolycoriella hygida]
MASGGKVGVAIINDGMLKVRSGPQRKAPGFQAQLICLTPWTNGSHPGQITSLCINSSYGLMAYGNEHGLVIVDIIQKICLLNVASPDLYGAQDPYSRAPRSPKRIDTINRDDQARSPSIDQLKSPESWLKEDFGLLGCFKFDKNIKILLNKLDSSFSRSRSSSMSSLENISSESVTCLAFADSYTKKSDPTTLLPTLWVGTSLGSVLTVSITLPDADLRKAQPVVVSILGGPIFRLKGSILSMSFLDCNGALIPYSYEAWKDENRGGTPTKNTNRMSPTLSGASGSTDSFSDRQFIAITSEKQARVVALPSQNCVYRQQIADTDYVVKAEIISLKGIEWLITSSGRMKCHKDNRFSDSVCLICYISTGHLLGYSLPSLRPLMDEDFLPLADLSFQTKCKQGIVDPMLSIWGQQLIVHEDTNHNFINEMIGELFIPHEMPEPPKESFFKGLFGGGSRNLDLGETSGKPNRSVAKHIPGPNLQELGQRASSATSEISRAHQLAMERDDFKRFF